MMNNKLGKGFSDTEPGSRNESVTKLERKAMGDGEEDDDEERQQR